MLTATKAGVQHIKVCYALQEHLHIRLVGPLLALPFPPLRRVRSFCNVFLLSKVRLELVVLHFMLRTLLCTG